MVVRDISRSDLLLPGLAELGVIVFYLVVRQYNQVGFCTTAPSGQHGCWISTSQALPRETSSILTATTASMRILSRRRKPLVLCISIRRDENCLPERFRHRKLSVVLSLSSVLYLLGQKTGRSSGNSSGNTVCSVGPFVTQVGNDSTKHTVFPLGSRRIPRHFV